MKTNCTKTNRIRCYFGNQKVIYTISATRAELMMIVPAFIHVLQGQLFIPIKFWIFLNLLLFYWISLRKQIRDPGIKFSLFLGSTKTVKHFSLIIPQAEKKYSSLQIDLNSELEFRHFLRRKSNFSNLNVSVIWISEIQFSSVQFKFIFLYLCMFL